MYVWILSLHILAATIWTGGHIVLSFAILPNVLKNRHPEALIAFEQKFEKIGMPALIVQVISGLWLSYRYLPDWSLWFDFSLPMAHGIAAKLCLLLLTLLLALDARFRVIPKLNVNNLWDMAWHIWGVTLLSLLFVIMGVSFRFGGPMALNVF